MYLREIKKPTVWWEALCWWEACGPGPRFHLKSDPSFFNVYDSKIRIFLEHNITYWFV